MENRNKRATRSTKRKAPEDIHSTRNLTDAKAKESAKGKFKTSQVTNVPVGNNTRGFPTFPDELFLEVLSYYPTPCDLVSTEASEYQVADVIEYATRRDTLLALSQTCRSLRRFFRPYIWSRIEVCSGIRTGVRVLSKGQSHTAVKRKHNEELVRQLEIVTVRDPSLAEYVKLINVEVREYSAPTVLAELARCMALFRHLRTVKLGMYPSKLRSDRLYTAARKAFSQYSYPQIEVAILSRSAYPLLRSCPSVRSVDRMDGHWRLAFYANSGFWDCIQSFCTKVESLTMNMKGGDAQEILRALPNLRQITLRFHSGHYSTTLISDQFAMLERLQHLQSIRIETTPSVDASGRQYIVDLAVQLLLKLQLEDKEDKEVNLWHMTGKHKTEATYLPAPKLKQN
ncbi:hypothetical protein GALMADRAFT_95156 [Galerina marginata CBS 339.88]|uniref:F-box domain-containing protein n=1 Tax=Galerina marginata (strain CBS 339.88) TaxID=685588 RepID=A0A067TC05_GALM3|nr:hypothetical protein GALMADRAFT_95156 [Galerina marginata CBS 339.88]